MRFWEIIGLILTALGTGLSFWQAHKAKTYKNEILSDRKKLTLIELSITAKRAREECQKITTQLSGKIQRGVNQQAVIDKIQNLIDHLKENQHRFNIPTFAENITSIEKGLATYKSTENAKDRQEIGDALYSNINQILAKFKQAFDTDI